MREERFETRMVEKRFLAEVKTSCDLCGFDEDESYIWTFNLGIDPDGCAGTRITRDVCQDCYDETLAPLTDPLLTALKAGDETLTEYHNDRWYG